VFFSASDKSLKYFRYEARTRKNCPKIATIGIPNWRELQQNLLFANEYEEVREAGNHGRNNQTWFRTAKGRVSFHEVELAVENA
jgi:hypothetical protein